MSISTIIRGVKKLPRKVFGSRNDRLLKQYQRQIPSVGMLEDDIRNGFDERLTKHIAEQGIADASEEEREALWQAACVELSADLRSHCEKLAKQFSDQLAPLNDWWNDIGLKKQMEEYYKEEYRKRHAKLVDTLDTEGLVAQAFALMREASRRAKNHRHFDCQLIGGRILFEGKIAEMRTGEGKTIVCHLAAFLHYLSGLKAHVITVNDYLVKRDAEFAHDIFELLGITVGHIQSQVDPGGREGIRRQAYACDVTYGTNSEFGFDYLRDNMKTSAAEQVQGRLDFVVVDEVDSILIDEARTPLIISGPAVDDITRYPRADKVAEELVRRQKTWDRKVLATIGQFDGDTNNIPKLGDAMAILGYRATKKGSKKKTPVDDTEKSETTNDDDASDVDLPLGPDFLTDDHVDAIQMYESAVLGKPPSEVYHRFFIVQKERKQVGITHEGVTVAQELLDIGSLYSGANMEWPHLVENALRAHKVYRRDTDYVVQDGQIVIVDQFTGRLMIGRQWSDGLHQAVEAKERVRVKEETQTLATITIQNFIKLYSLKSGMTGTAMTEATEFDKIYKLEVVEIPTNRPVNRLDHNDKMYRDVDQKYEAIVEEVHQIRRRGRPADPFLMADVLTALKTILDEQGRDTSQIDEAMRQFNNAEMGDAKVTQFMLETYDEMMGDLAVGRPILVGTTSVENSEKLSNLLTKRYGIEHEVLNAKNHSREADIVAKAGFCTTPTKGGDKTPLGNVTIATNMAGRGTDIKLGLNVVYPTCKVPAKLPDGVNPSNLYPTGTTKCCIHCDEYDAATNCAHCFKPKLDPRFPALGRKVCAINSPCGLHIIGTERHEARRIDNQLRGRAGRQGDPGSSRFSLSLQDDLLKLFMSDWMLKMMEKLGFSDGASLEDKRLSKGIERAQRKVEERNFSTRKHLLEWDEPMDYQRKEFYAARQQILEQRDLPLLILDTIQNVLDTTLQQYLHGTFARASIAQWCSTQLDLNIPEESINMDDIELVERSIRRKATEEAHDQIRTSVGEYVDPEDPPNKWDVGGLIQWAQRMFKFSMTQNHMRKMDPADIEEALLDAAQAHYDALQFSGLEIFLDELYPQKALAHWASVKFNIKVDVDELTGSSTDEIAELLMSRVRESYRQREIAYPVESCIDRALDNGEDSTLVADMTTNWANAKFRVGWKVEDVQGQSIGKIKDDLMTLSRSFHDGKLEAEIDEVITGKKSEEIIAWAKDRFGPAWNEQALIESNGQLRETLLKQGLEMLRWELTRLEQYVLLRIYDNAWKDHLLEMDHLKSAIQQRPLGGDQSHPQSQFAIEGRDLFSQMWNRIADRVTDIVFKIQETSQPGSSQGTQTSGSRPVNYGHADATGAGFSGASQDQQAAMRAQGSDGKVETIRREEPKIGRNDPCPCGSGKKFKQCHGKRN